MQNFQQRLYTKIAPEMPKSSIDRQITALNKDTNHLDTDTASSLQIPYSPQNDACPHDPIIMPPQHIYIVICNCGYI